MKDLFHFIQKPYNLRNNSTLQRRTNCTVYFGIGSISSLTPQNMGAEVDIQDAKSLDILKTK